MTLYNTLGEQRLTGQHLKYLEIKASRISLRQDSCSDAFSDAAIMSYTNIAVNENNCS